ncbi:putative acyl-CoA N-acyltransferase [Medicago truncatula]|uniref:Putative acyl-CoA N-acyltransferase n=1 Tax=Medicago truncatula TaxID=3880 RepID=A0A396IL33_MEDTR|nr:putative acyl-CoA N-acyltransferase [Medicago truncatula]
MSSKKVCIRGATFRDVLDWNSNNNLVTRPNIGTLWKKLIHVADDCSGCIVAYLLSKEEEEGNGHFCIASLFVHHTYRKRRIATDLITATQNTMEQTSQCTSGRATLQLLVCLKRWVTHFTR